MSRFASNRRRGSAAVEFALVGTLFLTVLFAVIDLGRYMASRTALRAATAEVIRAAVTDATLTGCTVPKTLAVAGAPVLQAALLNVCVVRAADVVTVNADYTFTFHMPVFNRTPRTLRTSVTSPL
jgi:Flp pilus assembly protein TadG